MQVFYDCGQDHFLRLATRPLSSQRRRYRRPVSGAIVLGRTDQPSFSLVALRKTLDELVEPLLISFHRLCPTIKLDEVLATTGLNNSS